MQTHAHPIWRLRIVTFSLAAMAAASATYWVLKWTAPAAGGPAATVVFPEAGQTDPQVVARLLGGGQTGAAAVRDVPNEAPAMAGRFTLTGVVAERSKGGYALISIDGKPAKPFRVGASVNEGLVLHSVAPRSASLAASLDMPVALTLELPPLTK